MIDFTPILNYVAEIAIAVLTPVILYLVKRAADRIGMEIGDGAAATVERYVEFGIEAIADRVTANQSVTDNSTVESMVQWVSDHAPKAMRESGLSASDVRSLIRRRLADG